MRLTKYSHSCVRIEHDGAVVVIDPGSLSERAALDGVDTVLITHEHPDHVDVDALVDTLGTRPSVEIYANPETARLLDRLSGGVHEVVPGDEFTAAGLRVRVYGGLHAIIHPELPRVANVGFFVEGAGGAGGVYHPGDSFEVPTDADVDTLFVPISGTWLKLVDVVEFVRRVLPRRAFALHDGLTNEAGACVYDQHLANLAGAEYARLAVGRSV